MPINPRNRDINREIDRVLRKKAPDRYKPWDDKESAWLDDVAAEIEPLIKKELLGKHGTQHDTPEKMLEAAIKKLARERVGQREGIRTKSGNDFIRSLFNEQGDVQQLPLLWQDLERDAITVTDKFPERVRGRMELVEKEVRVAIGAATPAEIRNWVVKERERNAAAFVSAERKCTAGDYLADDMERLGMKTTHDWLRWISGEQGGGGAAA